MHRKGSSAQQLDPGSDPATIALSASYMPASTRIRAARAFLVDRLWHLYDAFVAGDIDTWKAVTGA